jgi:competence protein CoiA
MLSAVRQQGATTMRFALMDQERHEAQPGLRGVCPNCGSEVIAKCGQRRVWHWSHLGKLECDHWWEPETEWHRSWKDQFPKDWQEVPHTAANGERHIADVKTGTGAVLEFQHSPISPEERSSREDFYRPMLWVADGLCYKRDLEAFRRALASSHIVRANPLYLEPFGRDIGLFQRWKPRQCPVFLDFADEVFLVHGMRVEVPAIWQLLLRKDTGTIIIAPVSRASFLQFCLTGAPLQYLVVDPGQRPKYLRSSRSRRRF